MSQAFAQEAPVTVETTPEGGAVVTEQTDAAHTPAAGDAHTTTAADHGGEHSGVFPPFDGSTFGGQLLWLAITFGALYLLMSRVALPRIGAIIEDRRARIDADLAEADALRQQTDAAIARYEAELADARSRSAAIAEEARQANRAELDARRMAVESNLAAKVRDAEADIQVRKAAALGSVDEIAADTVQAIVGQLAGETSPEAARAAVRQVLGS